MFFSSCWMVVRCSTVVSLSAVWLRVVVAEASLQPVWRICPSPFKLLSSVCKTQESPTMPPQWCTQKLLLHASLLYSFLDVKEA